MCVLCDLPHPAQKEEAGPKGGSGSARSTPTGSSSSKKAGAEKSGGKGVIGWLGSVVGLKGPKQADLGQAMEAYFDKDKNRWVFPGEEDAPEADAALGPPPSNLGVSASGHVTPRLS
jgi:hypothetical protein